jgi:hypothetical protein
LPSIGGITKLTSTDTTERNTSTLLALVRHRRTGRAG